jgi:peptide-methionine (R)-S-oxide reductase
MVARSVLLFSLMLYSGCQKTSAEDPAERRVHSPDSTGLRVYSYEEGRYRMSSKVVKTDEEWRKILTPEQFRITRMRGTELACSGAYWNKHDEGRYVCVCCDLDLFTSDTKFESGTGWPSFWKPVAKENIREEEDNSFGMRRTEILCARCDAHLGHVFDDGPEPTGLRYCLNSVAMKFIPKK